MGKSRQGIHGNYNGRVGNVVARKSQGRVILSIYQPNVANPRTAKQESNRSRFAFISNALRPFLSVAELTAKKWYQFGTYWSNFIKKNYFVGFSTSTPIETYYDKLVLAEGTLTNPMSPTASVDSGTLGVTWTINTGDNVNPNDLAVLVAYNPTNNEMISQVTTAKRSDRQATLTCPSYWNGDNAECYFFMKAADSNEFSDSIYLGSQSF